MVASTRQAATAIAVLIAFATPLPFVTAALGSKFGLWDWRFGLGVMTRDWGPPLAICGMAATALSVLFWTQKGPRWPIALLALAFLGPALCLYGRRWTIRTSRRHVRPRQRRRSWSSCGPVFSKLR